MKRKVKGFAGTLSFTGGLALVCLVTATVVVYSPLLFTGLVCVGTAKLLASWYY